MKKKLFELEDVDVANLEEIKRREGITKDVQAVRLALERFAKIEKVVVPYTINNKEIINPYKEWIVEPDQYGNTSGSWSDYYDATVKVIINGKGAKVVLK